MVLIYLSTLEILPSSEGFLFNIRICKFVCGHRTDTSYLRI